MKAKLILVILVAIVIMSGSLFAQITPPSEPIIIVEDTLYVFPTYNDTAFDALNRWIDYGFSLDPPVKVFKLARNETYKVSHTISTTRHLHIVAEKPDLDNAPPLVIGATDLNNEFPKTLIDNLDSLTLKNIYFCGADIEAPVLGECALVVHGVKESGDSCRVLIDGCYFEWFGRGGCQCEGIYNEVIFTNNLGMNCLGLKAKPGVGSMFTALKKSKSRIIRNNTSINNGAWSLNVGARKDIHYGPGIIDHNTIINEVRYVFYGAMWTDAVVSNNILYNVNSWGESEVNKQGQDPDAMSWGVINIDTLNAYPGLDSVYAALKGISASEAESHRRLEVRNNYYGWTDEVIEYWNSFPPDSIDRPEWMNERTRAMFDDDEHYPGLIEEGTYSQEEYGDPQFLGGWKDERNMEDFIKYMRDALRGGASEPLYYPYAPVEGYPQPNPKLTWPPVFDLRVGNAALVGTDGKPLGDLNWYPEYAERWDMTGWGREMAVKEMGKSVPETFSLEQNYPNPFNLETRIRFTLPNAGNVKLTVYNIRGERVKTLVDRHKPAGIYYVRWNGTNSEGKEMASGVYFYKLQMGSNVQVKRMLLMK